MSEWSPIVAHCEVMVEQGLMERNEAGNGPAYRLTEAGKDYVESVMLAGVESLEAVYALGRRQGLREAEKARR